MTAKLTIEQLQSAMALAIGRAFREVLPAGLQAGLIGLRPEVVLRHPSGRKVKRTAPSNAWSPLEDLMEVTFRENEKRIRFPRTVGDDDTPPETPPAAPAAQAPFPNASAPETGSAQLAQLVRALAQAEASPTHRFVSLKWFRDQALGHQGIYFPDSKDLLETALRAGMVKTRKEANPRNPEFPVTAIYLDRQHPAVRKVLDTPARRFSFQPIEIKGEPLSATVIRDRR